MALVQNKKARFDYEIIKEFEAGISLFGFEVKSLRSGRGNLAGAHVLVRGGEAFLVGSSIPPYQVANTPESYDLERPRTLLLHKKELEELARAEEQNGLTVIALSLYNKNRKIKLSLAIARGKKKQDKRETIKKRDTQRDIRRSLKIR